MRSVLPYETRLERDRRWALSEASDFFSGGGGVQESLRRITRRLEELSIPYAVAGGMALFQHGHRRFTEDIDILVSREGLRAVHEHLDGLGYVPPFAGSKNLKDVQSGVRIEFLITGDYPGDGKPKPVAFADPADVSVVIDGIRYLNLPTLVEMKLASGMTNVLRTKDIGDVVELIQVLKLPSDFVQKLNPYVREKYTELWQAVAATPKDE